MKVAVGLAVGGALMFFGWTLCAANAKATTRENAKPRCIHCNRPVFYAMERTRFGTLPAWRHVWNGRKHCHEAPSTIAEVAA